MTLFFVAAENFKKVMPTIPAHKVQVVYPPCDVDSHSVGAERAIVARSERPANAAYTFLSMNRFWPEKRLDIVVEATAILIGKSAVCLRAAVNSPLCFFPFFLASGLRPRVQLAGSVMPHIPESRIYYGQLKRMCEEFGVAEHIEFVVSPSEALKFSLYRQCDSALYTPANEHFGIVPIEALEQRRPVIVIDSGGPAETVIENVTGTKIAQPCAQLLATAMAAHMRRETWEHLDDDVKYERQVRRPFFVVV